MQPIFLGVRYLGERWQRSWAPWGGLDEQLGSCDARRKQLTNQIEADDARIGGDNNDLGRLYQQTPARAP